MRHRQPRHPKSGEQREREGFLFLPKRCKIESDEYQVEERWLEKAKWKETYYSGYTHAGWESTEWLSNGKDSYSRIAPSTVLVLLILLVIAVVVAGAALMAIYG